VTEHLSVTFKYSMQDKTRWSIIKNNSSSSLTLKWRNQRFWTAKSCCNNFRTCRLCKHIAALLLMIWIWLVIPQNNYGYETVLIRDIHWSPGKKFLARIDWNIIKTISQHTLQLYASKILQVPAHQFLLFLLQLFIRRWKPSEYGRNVV